MTRYPRDMRGYGAHAPHPAWPNDAKIAVQFVLNYEEGGENCTLHGDAASEAFLSDIPGAAQWQGQRHWNMESIYEYGARAGFWRLHRLFTGADIPLTINCWPSALGDGRSEVTIEYTLNNPRLELRNVVVTIPFSKAVNSVNLEATFGHFSWDDIRKVLPLLPPPPL